LNSLLQRQLKKLGLSSTDAPNIESWQQLLQSIDAAYQHADKVEKNKDLALEVSTKEMYEYHAALKQQKMVLFLMSAAFTCCMALLRSMGI